MKSIIMTIIAWLSWAASSVQALTTIDANHRWAYGANFGWMDWRGGSVIDGVFIGTTFCSGYIYAANVGWINLGNGAPENCTSYVLPSEGGSDVFGVNVNISGGVGLLNGVAYGANIGWVNFEQTYGKPQVNLNTGDLSGYAWSANCGWISLSNAVAFVQTDTILPAEGAPILYSTYSPSGKVVTIYWQACPSWILEQNNNLTISSGWSPTGGVTTVNGTNYATFTPPIGDLFFRLIYQ
jgi:hypothetical protein